MPRHSARFRPEIGTPDRSVIQDSPVPSEHAPRSPIHLPQVSRARPRHRLHQLLIQRSPPAQARSSTTNPRTCWIKVALRPGALPYTPPCRLCLATLDPLPRSTTSAARLAPLSPAAPRPPYTRAEAPIRYAHPGTGQTDSTRTSGGAHAAWRRSRSLACLMSRSYARRQTHKHPCEWPAIRLPGSPHIQRQFAARRVRRGGTPERNASTTLDCDSVCRRGDKPVLHDKANKSLARPLADARPLNVRAEPRVWLHRCPDRPPPGCAHCRPCSKQRD